ncbi:hypothetical protein EK21DRAFT_80902, partial [Setomelanomma holmii]
SSRTLEVWGSRRADKTQLVLDHVRQHRTEYEATFMIEARLIESARVCWRGDRQRSVEDGVTGVRSLFASLRGPWLLVSDDADTIEDHGTSSYPGGSRHKPSGLPVPSH